MQLIVDDFIWQRPASRKKGFVWGGAAEDPCLIRVPGAEFKTYRPHPGIFRDFADLEQTPQAVLNFANRYGALRQRFDLDSLTFWRTGIRQMKQLVTLSDAVTAGEEQHIAKALEPFLAEPSLANAADIRPIRQKQKRREKVSRNEQAHAAVMRLYHAIAPSERFEAEGFWNAQSGKVALRLKYANLLGFMFFQLGHALLGGRQFRQCAACGKWSLLQPGFNRADRTTCSGYCRLRLYRQRKAKAAELYGRGWSVPKIAQEIDSDVSTVTKWLCPAKE